MATIQEMIAAAVDRKATHDLELEQERIRVMRNQEREELERFRGWVESEIFEALGEVVAEERTEAQQTIYLRFSVGGLVFCAYAAYDGWRIFLPNNADVPSQNARLGNTFSEEFLLALGFLIAADEMSKANEPDQLAS